MGLWSYIKYYIKFGILGQPLCKGHSFIKDLEKMDDESRKRVCELLEDMMEKHLIDKKEN